MSGATVVRSLVLREPSATFASTPELEPLRPGPDTPVAGLFLAGGAAECHAKYAVRTRGGGWSALLAPEDTVYFHFPLDRAVRGLPWIIAPSGLKHSVQEAEGAGDALRGARLRKSRTSLDVLKYKPERRAIVVADAETVNEATGEGGRLRMVARAYGEYEATSGTIAALLRRLGDAASRGDMTCVISSSTCSLPKEKGWAFYPPLLFRILLQELPAKPCDEKIGRHVPAELVDKANPVPVTVKPRAKVSSSLDDLLLQPGQVFRPGDIGRPVGKRPIRFFE